MIKSSLFQQEEDKGSDDILGRPRTYLDAQQDHLENLRKQANGEDSESSYYGSEEGESEDEE